MKPMRKPAPGDDFFNPYSNGTSANHASHSTPIFGKDAVSSIPLIQAAMIFLFDLNWTTIKKPQTSGGAIY
jgi:hypothetical protein